MSLKNVEHIVHLMFENRSFDNLLGFVYGPNDLPAHNFPAQNPTTFDGLAFGGPYVNLDKAGKKVTAKMPTTKFGNKSPNVVPTPDPGEPFDDVAQQLGGPPPDMSGFVANYEKRKGIKATLVPQIMQSYSPEQLPVISKLARSFAVSDRWFCSMPTQTWPNRGFAHAGSSAGKVTNGKPPIPWRIDTIFTCLEKLNIPWKVYHDTIYEPALTRIQFFKHWADALDTRFLRIKHFFNACNAPANAPAKMKLPKYSFVEPRFLAERVLLDVHHSEDYHPPNNVQHAEKFLADVYNAIRSCPYRDKILLVITFDEHGGTYDHVPPPDGAKPPKPNPVAENGFPYDRFGVRVPAIVVSSWVKPGTVFRSDTDVPFDHTSVLATLRDWLKIPANKFLPSPRIQAAPTLANLLTEEQPLANWPEVTPIFSAEESLEAVDVEESTVLDQPPDDLENSMVAATRQYVAYRTGETALEAVAPPPQTRRDAREEMRRMMLTDSPAEPQ